MLFNWSWVSSKTMKTNAIFGTTNLTEAILKPETLSKKESEMKLIGRRVWTRLNNFERQNKLLLNLKASSITLCRNNGSKKIHPNSTP